MNVVSCLERIISPYKCLLTSLGTQANGKVVHKTIGKYRFLQTSVSQGCCKLLVSHAETV